jgi:hypothetical protein
MDDDAMDGPLPPADMPLGDRIRAWSDRLEAVGADAEVLAAVRAAADFADPHAASGRMLADLWVAPVYVPSPGTIGELLERWTRADPDVRPGGPPDGP